ncbi:hypothetical protein [Lacrimispora sp.]|uniref:hypothetical protein n=1 Tax=Lacrimispora sp. TaxID=2719234 RepID=UPI00289EA5F8|nr:hypothetical protein [Lacrimispora sp.]
MGNETKNYKFPKPSEDDFYDISEYNKAMDILDETLTEMSDRKLDSNGNASDVVTEFSQEILRNNIESGEKLSVSHGKVQKWFSEMKNIAFSGLASDVAQDAAHRYVTDTEKNGWNAKVSASGGDISGTKIGSLETITSEFPVPAEGETPKVFLGKVKKFIQDFNDFKAGVITVGKLVNNGQTSAAGYALDARYGKTLYDLYAQLNRDYSYYGHIRYGIKFFTDSGNKDWVRIPLADLGFPNDTLTEYPCVIALPQINITDTQNTNRDIIILCSKPNGDRKSIELLLNRSFTNGALFSVWYTAK